MASTDDSLEEAIQLGPDSGKTSGGTNGGSNRKPLREKVRRYTSGIRGWIVSGVTFIIFLIITLCCSLLPPDKDDSGPNVPASEPGTEPLKKPVTWYMKGPLIHVNTGVNVSSAHFIDEVNSYRPAGIIVPYNIIKQTNSTSEAGSIENEFKYLTQETQKLGIGVIVDLIIDSVDINDELFASANKTFDYFVWTYHDMRNNSLWKYDESRRGYYETAGHDRVKLNLNNENLLRHMAESVAWWIRNGARGVRINTVSNLHALNSASVIKLLKEAVVSANELAILMTSEEMLNFQLYNYSSHFDVVTSVVKDIDVPILTAPLFSTPADSDNINIIQDIIKHHQSRPAVEIAYASYDAYPGAYLLEIFSLLLPATPVFLWSNITPLKDYNGVYSEVLKIRQTIADYESEIAVPAQGKFVLSRYNKNGGYLAVLSVLYDEVYINLNQFARNAAHFKLICKTAKCTEINHVGSTVSADKFQVKNLCVQILSFKRQQPE